MGSISSDAISKIRKALDFTQQEFGDLFFLSSKTIMRWEQGKSLPTQDQVGILEAFQKALPQLERGKLRKTFVFEGTSRALHYLLSLSFKESDLCGQRLETR